MVDSTPIGERPPAPPSAKPRGSIRRGKRLVGLVRPYVLALLAVGPLGVWAVSQVIDRAGEPSLPLDDAFIHLQYARRLAEGHFFSYVAGEGYSSGATSLLWPALLALFAACGIDGTDMIWVVWLLGALSHAGVVVETERVATGLAGRLAGGFAAAMSAVFGAFVWFGYSGMETIPLAWLLMRTARVAAESTETPLLSARRRREVVVLGVLGPLLRPEGALASLIAVIALLRCRWPRRAARRRDRVARLASAALPLCAPALPAALHWTMTGHAASATAMVKWLVLDPYLDTARLASAILANVHFLWTNLLQGGPWTTVFLPPFFGFLLLAGLLATLLCGWARTRRVLVPTSLGGEAGRPQRFWRALFVVVVALGMLIPCTYGTMLWNRVRYLWPFAPAWFVAIACLGSVLGSWGARRRRALGALAPALLGAMVGALASGLRWSVFDLAQSARAIARQQVELARWAAVLPPDARIGVNDTGAIAYLSGRRTFDVVGLTTPGEARHWVAGAGSRFEHYERLDANRLPTHFIVYPEWMACAPVLGEELHRATVVDQTILGGTTMVAYEARYDLLHSGSRPFTHGPWGQLLAVLDVADLDSERDHRYVLGATVAADNAVIMWPTPDGRVIADAGRFRRRVDQFHVALPPNADVSMVMRVVSPEPLEVLSDGRRVATASLPDESSAPSWVELAVRLPPQPASASTRREFVVRPVGSSEFASFHYWWFTR